MGTTSYKDTSCSTIAGGGGPSGELCVSSPPRPPSQLPVSMTAAARPVGSGLFCKQSAAKLVPEDPYKAVLDTCRIQPIPCYRGTAERPERCYRAPAGRLCRNPPGDVCPSDFPVRVRVHQDGSLHRVNEFRRCTACACKTTNVACEGGGITAYCDTTCSGDGACSTPKVALGEACVDLTEIMSQPFSWRQTLPVVRGACDPVQSTLSYQFAPQEAALCCEPE